MNSTTGGKERELTTKAEREENGNFNQGGMELAERIKANLAERQHRFELQDPFADTTYRFDTSEAAVTKADKLGSTRIQNVATDNSVMQVNKVNGKWVRDDGKPLTNIQEAIDLESLRAIETRAEQRAAVEQGIDAETDKLMAQADAHAFLRIQAPQWQESAAGEMANSARQYPEYKGGLDKAIPGYPGTAEKVYALDATNDEKVAAKEMRKSREYTAMIAESEVQARKPAEIENLAQRGINVPIMNNITEGKDRELPPNADGEILKAPTPASEDLRREIAEASAFKMAGQSEESRSRSSIESRTDLRLAATNEAMRADPARDPSTRLLDQETARQWTDLDASDFGRVRSATRREHALEAVAGHARLSPEYADELKKRSPALAEAAQGLNEKLESERARQAVDAQRGADLSAAAKTREAMVEAAMLARWANTRAKQTAELVHRLADSPDQVTKELREARDLLKAPPLDGRVTAPNDPDIAARIKRSIKRPIADEELSKALLERFIVSHEKRGLLDKGATEFTFRDGQLQGTVAFVDSGKTINTMLNDKNTVRAMVEVAKAKNWKEVTVSGTDEFKRAAWLEARLNGFDVRGYEVRDADKRMLEELQQQQDKPSNSITVSQRELIPEGKVKVESALRKHIDGDALTPHEKSVLDNSKTFLQSKEMGDTFTKATLRELESRIRGERVYIGELVEHGSAPYQFNKENSASHYVVLKTQGGEQVIWGKGLDEAMKDRNTGEQIVLQNIGKKAVVVPELVRDAQGNVVNVRSKDAQLNEWKAELLSQYTDKALPIGASREGQAKPVMQVYDSNAPRKPSSNPRPGRTIDPAEIVRKPREKRQDPEL